MEIYKIKRNNCEVNVIFTGAQYIFHNSFYGLLAVADRKGYSDDVRNHFIVRYGNENTIGGSFAGDYCLSMAKSFIKRNESLYVNVKTTFEEVKEDINHIYYIDCKASPRK